MTYKLKLNQIREVLNMEVKLESAKLIDGITMVSYEKLEPGFGLFVVDAEGIETPAPVGEHTLEDGTSVEVDENGIIMEVSAAEEEASDEEVAPEDAVIEVSGSKKKFEDMPEESKSLIDVAMAEIANKIEEKMKMVFEVVEEIAGDIATVKEEVAMMKTKMEKFSKAPASNPIPKVSNVETKIDAFESKLNFLKSITKK